MKKTIKIALVEKYIDFQGKPDENINYVKIPIVKKGDAWTAHFSDEFLKELIEVGNKRGMSISLEE